MRSGSGPGALPGGAWGTATAPRPLRRGGLGTRAVAAATSAEEAKREADDPYPEGRALL